MEITIKRIRVQTFWVTNCPGRTVEQTLQHPQIQRRMTETTNEILAHHQIELNEEFLKNYIHTNGGINNRLTLRRSFPVDLANPFNSSPYQTQPPCRISNYQMYIQPDNIALRIVVTDDRRQG